MADKEEQAFGKETKRIWDRAESNLTAGLGAAIEEEKAKLRKEKK